MSNDLVSVVMPVWQPRRAWLEDAIASVLGQQHRNLELIIVDDGNAEPVAPLIAHFADQRIRLLRIKHGGHAGARNAGMAAARGSYIRHFDADDIMPPESTAELLALGEGKQVITYGATQFCDDTLSPTSVLVCDISGDARADCILGRFSIRHPAMLFPRRVMQLTGPFQPGFRVSGDWEYVLRALEHAPVRGTQKITLYYRRHSGSIIGTATIAAGEEAWRRIIDEYFDRHPEERRGPLHRKALAAVSLNKASAYAHAGELRTALDRLVSAAPLDRRGTVSTAVRLLRAGLAGRGRRLLRRLRAA